MGYISCTTFGGDTVGHFNQAFETYGSQADLWIVDLRDNPEARWPPPLTSAGAFTGQEPSGLPPGQHGGLPEFTAATARGRRSAR